MKSTRSRRIPSALALSVALACVAPDARAVEAECAIAAFGATAARADASRVAREADRRLDWVLRSLETLGDELEHADFSRSPRSRRQRDDVLGAVVRMAAMPWLEAKHSACACVAGPSAPPACARLEADAERLRQLLPRRPLRRPIDIDRLTKGR